MSEWRPCGAEKNPQLAHTALWLREFSALMVMKPPWKAADGAVAGASD